MYGDELSGRQFIVRRQDNNDSSALNRSANTPSFEVFSGGGGEEYIWLLREKRRHGVGDRIITRFIRPWPTGRIPFRFPLSPKNGSYPSVYRFILCQLCQVYYTPHFVLICTHCLRIVLCSIDNIVFIYTINTNHVYILYVFMCGLLISSSLYGLLRLIVLYIYR